MTAIDSALRQARNQNNSPLHALTHSSEATHSGARVGQLLCGRYRLELLLGKGAMGEVYRATDTERQEPCAIKLVLPEASLPLQAQRRLVQEAKVISRLYHPNIVEVREFLQDRDGTCLLVMELLQGVDLQTVLHKQGRLPLWRALEIARSVGAALQYAHEMGVIHRDISPGKVCPVGACRRFSPSPRLSEREMTQRAYRLDLCCPQRRSSSSNSTAPIKFNSASDAYSARSPDRL